MLKIKLRVIIYLRSFLFVGRGDRLTFMEKLIGKREEIDIEEVLNSMDSEEEDVYADADALVRPVLLTTDADRDLAIAEAKKGNIILLNIADISKRNPIKLRDYISQIKKEVESINGDIARISQEKVIVTPSRVKIVKSKHSK